MGPSELLEHVVAVFERLEIPYLVTGSTGILMTSGTDVDRTYIERWAQQLGLGEIWEAIEKRLRS